MRVPEQLNFGPVVFPNLRKNQLRAYNFSVAIRIGDVQSIVDVAVSAPDIGHAMRKIKAMHGFIDCRFLNRSILH